jgi:hypothetical protein
MQRYATSVVLCLSALLIGCSGHLSRSTAERLLREKVNKELTAETGTTDLSWIEAMWGSGKQYEQTKQSEQAVFDFYNELVTAGVFRKKGERPVPCKQERYSAVNCKQGPNVIYAYETIPSADVRVLYPHQRLNGMSIETGVMVLARSTDVKVTGISEQGQDANVEFEVGYGATALYKRLLPIIQDSLAKCSLPGLSANRPFLCARKEAGDWPTEAQIREKKLTGSAEFKKYDDGWRVIQVQ